NEKTLETWDDNVSEIYQIDDRVEDVEQEEVLENFTAPNLIDDKKIPEITRKANRALCRVANDLSLVFT
ncbi:MAG: hypothetical protein NZM26_02330, partial [Patescibacteria group bacterium]|nr:hypothetical protein [Patescibacteria group bacterium]